MRQTPAQTLALAPLPLEIPDDEAPTAFYRRPRRAPPPAGPKARSEGSGRASPPPDERRRRRRRAKTEATPPAPPRTLLLPTSEAPELTSDGTILSPLAQPTKVPAPRGRRAQRSLGRAGGQLAAAWAWLAESAGALRASSVGLGLITSAITFACGGVAVVAYVYLSSADPAPSSSPSAHTRAGPIPRAVDLAERLREEQGPLEEDR